MCLLRVYETTVQNRWSNVYVQNHLYKVKLSTSIFPHWTVANIFLLFNDSEAIHTWQTERRMVEGCNYFICVYVVKLYIM
jgi:hypothetical protein